MRWWDGARWSAHSVPAYGPPPPPLFEPQKRTSGYAVASLVLSVLWIGGIGAVLAVPFAARARRDIRRSGGELAGAGMATAGLVIGIVGLVGAVVLWTTVAVIAPRISRDIHRAFSPENLPMGQVAQVQGSLFTTGLRTVNVHSLTYPVASEDPFRSAPTPGDEFAVADVEVCAGRSGATGPDLFDFSVVLPGDVREGAISGSVRNPSLTDLHSLPAGQCARGFIPFQIPSGAHPLAVQFGVINGFRWVVATTTA